MSNRYRFRNTCGLNNNLFYVTLFSCTLREDLLQEVEQLCKKGDIEQIIIESTGISEPVPVAQTFSYMDEEMYVHHPR